ncbi:MAG: hypothetical protein FJ280_00570 [Planctomycetes bacterium]|nr:hypothetical protein [Planctomycetota bacterium]
MNSRRWGIGVALVAFLFGLLAAVPRATVTANEGGVAPGNMPRSDLSLEGIWTPMTPTPAGRPAILSLVVSAQGSEGLVYTCVGKHPECSPTAYRLTPGTERVSDLLGHLVRIGANTFRFSVVCHGIKGGGPTVLDIGETVYMVVLAGIAELADGSTMLMREFTYAAYTPAQDLDGDRLPDEGAKPVVCAALPQLAFKRLPQFPSCVPAPAPQTTKP